MKIMGDSNTGITNPYMEVTLRKIMETHDLSHPPVARQMGKGDKGNTDEEFDPSAAFLGPTLWEKTLTDFKLEYMDLDEFLNEQATGQPDNRSRTEQKTSCQPNDSKVPTSNTQVPKESDAMSPMSQSSLECFSSNDGSVKSIDNGPDLSDQSSCDNKLTAPVPVNFKIKPGDLALATVPGRDHFDPSNHTFSEDELRPQAMVKKSRKQFVPDLMKDDKYWARRSKNNQAARRSREARRVKENQIVLRASYLEKENVALKDEVCRLKEDNKRLWQRLNKYEM